MDRINQGGNLGYDTGSMGQSIIQTTSVMSCLLCCWSIGTIGHLSVTTGATGDPLRATNYTKIHQRFLYFFISASKEHLWPSHMKVASEMCQSILPN